MDSKEEIKFRIEYIGLFLLALILSTIIVSTAGFLVGFTINRFTFFISFALSAAFCILLSGKEKKQVLVSIAISSIILIGAIAVSGLVYDYSYDGNAYHKSMTGFLAYGWNPLKSTFFEYADNRFPFVDATETWYDAYAKGSEIWGACIYALTGNIEYGKSYNLLSIIITVLLSIWTLKKITNLKTLQLIIVGLLFAVNPVTLAEVFTFYNDGLIWHMVLVCILSCVVLTYDPETEDSKILYSIIVIAINIGFNVKFSAIIFFALPCAGIYIYWLIRFIKDKKYSKKFMLRSFIVFASAVICAVLITGASSYVINTVRYNNPLYTMIGNGATDIITPNTPDAIKEKNNIAQFLISLFSKTNNDYRNHKQVELKVPLYFDSTEYIHMQSYDPRIAGWGLQFSGIFIISVISICVYNLRRIGRQKKEKNNDTDHTFFHITVLFIIIFLIMIIFVPAMWMARYAVFLFFIPVAAVILCMGDYNDKAALKSTERQNAAPLIVSTTIIVLLLNNLIPSVTTNMLAADWSRTADAQAERIRKVYKYSNIDVSFGEKGKSQFFGRLFNMLDLGIEEYTFDESASDDSTGAVHQNYVYQNSYPFYYRAKDGIFASDGLQQYLYEISRLGNMIVVMSVKDEASTALDKDMLNSMHMLGLTRDLDKGFRDSYIAIISQGKVAYENESSDAIEFSGELNNHTFDIKSAGYLSGDRSSIRIDDKEYSLNRRGINIVLYSINSNEVIDSVNVDTFNDNVVQR